MYQVERVGMKQNKIIGLTGGIASGKSLVSSYIKQAGFPLIDGDEVAKNLQEEAQFLEKIEEAFPGMVVDGRLDREKMGRLVFAQEDQRRRLNQLMHPAILEAIRKDLSKIQGTCFIDLPLLIETMDAPGALDYDEIWLVWVPRHIQVQRLMERDGIDEAYALEKIHAQMDLDTKKCFANVIIDNSKTPDDTLAQLDKELARLWRGKKFSASSAWSFFVEPALLAKIFKLRKFQKTSWWTQALSVEEL